MEHYETTELQFLEKEIIERLEELSINYPDYAPPLYHLGEYYLNKDLDLSKAYLNRCLECGTQDIVDSAEELLEQISGVDKYDEAIELIKQGNGLEALKILIPIVVNNKEHFDAKFYSAVAYRQTGNFTKALIYLKELSAFAERAEVYSEIALNLAEIDDFDGALENLTKALKITPDDTGIICNIGVCKLNMGLIQEALEAFELVHRMNPEDDIALSWIEQINEALNRDR
jgi:tetratricopeptide (TPR) repeat protein